MSALQIVIMPAIMEVLVHLSAYLEMVIRGDGYITTIKEPMYIGSKQKAIGNTMFPALAEGLDMGGIQSWEYPFLGHRTSPLIYICDHNPKTALS